eukprot:GHVP01014207.1.p1 GENE.GHVP01014207.1~~GHVP01014207.1.p1  ORF type:complete len:954 (-),score=225.54 GHVP01014207.1:277-3138(-)
MDYEDENKRLPESYFDYITYGEISKSDFSLTNKHIKGPINKQAMGFFGFGKKKTNPEENSINSGSIAEVEDEFVKNMSESQKNQEELKKMLENMDPVQKIEILTNDMKRIRLEKPVGEVLKDLTSVDIPGEEVFNTILQAVKKYTIEWTCTFIESGGIEILYKTVERLLKEQQNEEIYEKEYKCIEIFGGILGNEYKSAQEEMIMKSLCFLSYSSSIKISGRALKFLGEFLTPGKENYKFILSLIQHQSKKSKSTYIFEGICNRKIYKDENSRMYVSSSLYLFNHILENIQDPMLRLYYRRQWINSGGKEINDIVEIFNDPNLETLLDDYMRCKKDDENTIFGRFSNLDSNKMSPLFQKIQEKFTNEKEKDIVSTILSFLALLPDEKEGRGICLKMIERKVIETAFEGHRSEGHSKELSFSDLKIAEYKNKTHELKEEINEKDSIIQKQNGILKEMEKRVDELCIKNQLLEEKEFLYKKEIEPKPKKSERQPLAGIFPNKKEENYLFSIKKERLIPKEEKKELEVKDVNVKKPVKEDKKEPEIKGVNVKPSPTAKAPPPPPKLIKPKSNNLKKIPWKQIPKTKLTDTIWTEIPIGKWDKLIKHKEIEEIFTIQTIKPTSSKKKQIVTFMEEKSARIVEISFQGNRISEDGFIESIKKLDLDDPNLIVADSLTKVVISDQDKKTLSLVKKEDSSLLTFSDRLFYNLYSIPFYEIRIKLIGQYKRSSSLLDETEKPSRFFMVAVKRAMYSTSFKEFLSLLLSVGNYMNGTTDKKLYIGGIDMDILTSLGGIKGKELSVLDFICKEFNQQYESSDLLREDLELISAGGNFSLSNLISEGDARKTEFKELVGIIETVELGHKEILEGVKKVEFIIGEIEKRIQKCKELQEKLKKYFFYDALGTTDVSGLFSLFKEFGKDYFLSLQTAKTKSARNGKLKDEESDIEKRKRVIEELLSK